MLNDGTIVLRNVINPVTIAQFKLWATNPERYHRGNATDGNYYGEHDGEREYDVWWTTQPPKEMWVPVVVQLQDPTMPNKSTEFRSALLINALKSDIIDRVQELDGNTDFVKK
jgi:hypothetical protein